MRFKYRIPALMLALMLAVSFQTAFVWAENEGEDAHSQSMSAESGEEPIEDISTTEDYTEADAYEEFSDAEDEDGDAEDAAEAEDSEQGEEDMEGEDAQDTDRELSLNISWKVIIPACLGGIALIAILIYAFRRWDS